MNFNYITKVWSIALNQRFATNIFCTVQTSVFAILAPDYFNHIYFCIHAFAFPDRPKWFFLKINVVKVSVAIYTFVFVSF